MAIVTVDFDGTLYQHSSVIGMIKGGHKLLTSKQEISIILDFLRKSLIRKKYRGDFRIVLLKSFFSQMEGKSFEEMAIFFEKALDMSQHCVNYELVSRIKEHIENNDHVIIISGALSPILELFIKKLNIQANVIGTPLCYDEKGLCTGKIGIVNRGEDKVKQIKLWITNNNVYGDSIWAYADSESDIPLLDFADKAIVVNPTSAMRKIAKTKEWEILEN